MNGKNPRLNSFSHLMLFLISFFCLSTEISIAETFSCKCKFDTDDYQATGYFAGTCSYAMDETRKKCTLRRAYDYSDIQEQRIKSDIFKNPRAIGKDLYKKVVNMYETPQALKGINPADLFSYLMRSSYLAAPFLNDKETLSIDNSLSAMLKFYGNDILYIFLGLNKKDKEKTFKKESEMFVKQGVAEFIVDIGNRKILVGTKVLPKIKH